MGYSWIAVTQNQTPAGTAIMQELVDNVKDVESQLECTGDEDHDWSGGMDPFSKTKIANELVEMRTAADNLDDKNICRTHYATHHVNFDSDEHLSHLATHYISYDNNQHSTHKGTNHTNYHNTLKSTYKSTHYGTYCGTNKGTF